MRTLRLKVELQASFLHFGGIALILLVAAALLELIFLLDTTARTVLAVLVLFVFVGFAAWYVVRPLLRAAGILPSTNEYELAKLVGFHFPAIHDRLLNLLQIHHEQQAGTSLYSPELIDASFQDIAGSVRELDFRDAVDRSPIDRSGRFFALGVVATLLLFTGMPQGMFGSFERLVYFTREYTSPARFEFEILPGDQEVVKGADVVVYVQVHARSGVVNRRELRLYARLEGQVVFEETRLRPDSFGVFSTTLGNIRGTTEYFVQLEDVRSAIYRLTVVDRPMLRQLLVRLDYPPYTKLPPRMQDEFVGDLAALPGTRVAVTGSANKLLRSGRIAFSDRSSLALAVDGQRFRANFSVVRPVSYHIEVNDTDNLANTDPITYQITVLDDEHPSVAIVQPGRNIDLAGHKTLPLVIQAKDDFGIARMRLGYRLVHSKFEEPAERHTFVDILLATPLAGQAGLAAHVEVPYTWNLAPLSLVPEDVVEYFAEVFDNDVISGPKSARSQIYLLRLPSLEEVFTELDRGHDRSMDDLKTALEEAKKLKDHIEAINQDFKQNKPIDWQQQKRAEELAKRYEELQKKLDEVKARVDEMVQKMQEQTVLSPETMEKYMELQHLFNQLNSAELQQVMKQLQQAMQNVDRQKLQQAMQQLTFSEQRFRESIERTLNLLKRIQIEQKLDEVKKRAQEIEQRQRELEEASRSDDPRERDDIARQQEDLVRKQEHLEIEAEDLYNRMREFFTEMPADQLEKHNRELQQQQLGQQMQQAAEHLRGGQLQSAQQLQQQIAQQVQRYAEQLDQLQQQMLQQQSQYILNEMRRAINNLLELSKRQEALKQQAQQAPPNSPQLRQNAQEQMRVLQDLGNVVNGLGELAQRSFAVTPEMGRSIGEAMMRMQNALRALDTRSGNQASQEQGGAMAALNQAATQVQNALQQLMQGGGGGMGSLMQQLQLMAGHQMGINMQTQALGQGSLGMEQAAQAARLAMEQEAIRKSLEQLDREAKASGEQQRILGDLGKIAEEMREVVENLQQQNVNPETLRKQERILSRMLDAARSMRERDYEQRRQGRTATQFTRRSPADLDPAALDGANRLREDLLRALEQGYSKDYQELIRKYFELLQKAQRDFR